jgi:hypothetical protein
MEAKPGSLPDLGALSHLSGTAFGTRAHAAVHGAVHDAFMTLPPYTRTREGEVHELDPGVRSCFHSARSDPWSEKHERIERACEGTSARSDSSLRIPWADGGYAPAGSMLMKEDGELDLQHAR